MSEVPFEVLEPIEIGDLSDQEGGDLIEAQRNVRVSIKGCTVKSKKTKEGEFTMTQLDPTFIVGPTGVDGNGKYKGKHFFGWKNLAFPGLLLSFNKDRYTSEWWNKQARYGLKQFLLALGYDPKQPPVVNDEFLQSLKGKELTCDVTKEEITEEVDGKYVKTGEYVNYLKNFKAIRE